MLLIMFSLKTVIYNENNNKNNYFETNKIVTILKKSTVI